jgi:Fe-S cluster biogenesis protein NfuA
MNIVFEAGEPGRAIIDNLGRDDLVGSLLLLYGLHPLDLESRVIQALEKLRPYMRSHGGSVELLSINDGAVRLRLEGSSNGCGSSGQTLKAAIEEAIYDAAPDITALEIEGGLEKPFSSGLVQLARSSNKG